MKIKNNQSLGIIFALWLVPCQANRIRGGSNGEEAEGGLNRLIIAEHEELNRKLKSERDVKVRIEVNPPSKAELKALDTPSVMGEPFKIGLVKDVGKTISTVKMGGRTTAIHAADAMGLRLKVINLRPGQEYYISNDRDETMGPYTSKNTWTNTLLGDTLYLDFIENGLANENRPMIAKVGYVTPKVFGGKATDLPWQAECNNEDCIKPAGTPSNKCDLPSVIDDARHATAQMHFVSGQYLSACSGGLVQNNSNKDFFLTAYHCISRDSEAASAELYFHYYTNECDTASHDPCPDHLVDTRSLGAQIIGKNRKHDITLLELSESPPGDSKYLPWSSDPIARSDGETLYSVSHPEGAPQMYSMTTVDTTFGYCTGWRIGDYIYSQGSDDNGSTDGGSSGSLVLNGNGEIVGTLTGSCGYNNYPCDFDNNRIVHGALSGSGLESSLEAGNGGDPDPTSPPGCNPSGHQPCNNCCSNMCHPSPKKDQCK